MKHLFSLEAQDPVSRLSHYKQVAVVAVVAVAAAALVSFPDLAMAAIGKDATAQGFAGVQGKLWKVWEGLTPILGLVTLALGGASMVRQYSLATTGGIIGVGGVITAGPTVIQEVSGAAVF